MNRGRRYAHDPRVLYRYVGPDAVVSVEGRHDFLYLRGSAGALWHLLEEPRTVPQLIQELSAVFEFEANGEAIGHQVEAFLTDLVEQGVARASDEPDD